MAIDKTSTELTEHQMELFNALTALQQRVCLNIIKGHTNVDSYKLAKEGKKVTQGTAEACVSRMLSNVKVKAFINSIKRQAINSAIMSREEALSILSNMARTATSDVVEFEHIDVETAPDKDGNTRIVKQTVWSIKDSAKHDADKLACISEVSVGKDGLKIKTHDQKDAIKILSKLEGWDKPSEADNVERQKSQEERILEMAAAVKVAGELK